MITKYFSVHNLVNIKIETTLKEKIDHVKFSLREFEVEFIEEEKIDIFIYDYTERPNFDNPIIVPGDYLYEKNYIDIPVIKNCFNLVDLPNKIYCQEFKISFSFFVEIILIKKGYSLIHASAVRYKDKDFIFPALGGVGKTATLSGIMKKGGKLFGDDFVIVGNGKILSYPLDFSIYEYHLNILGIRDKKVRVKFLLSRILDYPIKFFHNFNNRPSKLFYMILHSLKFKYIHFSPSFMFGKENIAKEGLVQNIYFLEKKDIDKDIIDTNFINYKELAEKCTNILFHEWHESFSLLYVYSVFSSFSIKKISESIQSIFEEEFKEKSCNILNIPLNLNYSSYLSQVISLLENDLKK